jgi:hypothetical protein
MPCLHGNDFGIGGRQDQWRLRQIEVRREAAEWHCHFQHENSLAAHPRAVEALMTFLPIAGSVLPAWSSDATRRQPTIRLVVSDFQWERQVIVRRESPALKPGAAPRLRRAIWDCQVGSSPRSSVSFSKVFQSAYSLACGVSQTAYRLRRTSKDARLQMTLELCSREFAASTAGRLAGKNVIGL